VGKVTAWGLDQILENYVNKEIATIYATNKYSFSVFVRLRRKKKKIKGEK